MSAAPTPQHAKAFGSSVAAYLASHRHKLNNFSWPMTEGCFNTAVELKLLSGPSVEGGFAETMQLRQAVAERALEIQKVVANPLRDAKLAELAGFVIAGWGNLNGNDPKTIGKYVARFTGIELPFSEIRCAEDLRAAVKPRSRRHLFAFKGVASWSKWLSFIWGDWALIYDARIAFALDAIHFIHGIDAPVFPVPSGRNPLLAHFDARSCASFSWLARRSQEPPALDEMPSWMASAVVQEKYAYSYYLAVMAETHHLLWPAHARPPLVHTEMLLFSLSIKDIAADFCAEMLTRFQPRTFVA